MKRLAAISVITLLCSLILAAGCSPAADGRVPEARNAGSPKAKVTYIANEGVLIESGEKRIVIDGFHRFYRDAYAFPPDDLRLKMEKGEGSWGSIDLILVSHTHGDHFSAESVAAHLESSRNAILISSPQVTDAVSSLTGEKEDIASRIRTIPYEWKTESSADAGVAVRVLNLRHGSERFRSMQNLGHVVELGGLKFLHIGDADMTDENFESYRLHEAGIDVAFIPYWFLLSSEGRDLVRRQFKPRHIVAVHISPSEAEEVRKQLADIDPSIRAFTKIMETAEF